MADTFQYKYRIASARAPWWDYGADVAYFITICTGGNEGQFRKHYFGDVVDGEMQLSEIGKLADQYWRQILAQFPFVKLDAHVVMPNHVHGFIVIDKTGDVAGNAGLDDAGSGVGRDAINCVSTGGADDMENKRSGITGNKNPMLHNNVSRIVRWYKGQVSFESRKINTGFSWQSRFHDHIIRDERSYQTIAHYIYQNPARWQKEKFYKN